ncbi:MAG: helix-turn-helix transcriptional regulator [Pseudonocardiaceae bacterium]
MSRDNQDKNPARRRRAAPNGVSTVLSDEQSTVHLGHRLRQCRDSRGLTQAQAAAEAGITRNALGRLEGKQFPNPCLQTLLALMQVYRLRSLEELFGPLPSHRLAKEWAEAGWAGTRHGDRRQRTEGY